MHINTRQNDDRDCNYVCVLEQIVRHQILNISIYHKFAQKIMQANTAVIMLESI